MTLYISLCEDLRQKLLKLFSTDNVCKLFGTKTFHHSLMMVFLKEYFEQNDFEKNNNSKRDEKLPSKQRVQERKTVGYLIGFFQTFKTHLEIVNFIAFHITFIFLIILRHRIGGN